MSRLTLVSTHLESAVSADRVEDFEGPECSLLDLLTRGPERPARWLDVHCPDRNDFEAILRPFSLHPWTLRDAITGEGEDKLEVFKKYYYIRVESLLATRPHQTSTKIHLLVFPNGLVSLSTTGNLHAGDLQAMILQRQYEPMSSTQICHAIIKNVLGSISSSVYDLKVETSNLEDLVTSCPTVDSRELWMRINVCRHEATTMTSGLRSKENLVRCLLRHARDRDHSSPLDDTVLDLRDIQSDILAMHSELWHINQRLSWCHSHHLGQFSLQRVQVRNRTLRIFRILTAVLAIFMALNGLVAAFGMNITIPGGDVDSYAWWIGVLSGVTLLFLLSMAILRTMKLM